LQESVAEGEERRTMQAPNREGVWSRSQQAREKAMVGPRFEQMIMYDQVSLSLHFTLPGSGIEGNEKEEEEEIGTIGYSEMEQRELVIMRNNC
jgi:hypothetical protein